MTSFSHNELWKDDRYSSPTDELTALREHIKVLEKDKQILKAQLTEAQAALAGLKANSRVVDYHHPESLL